jgi:hypothetical protein
MTDRDTAIGFLLRGLDYFMSFETPAFPAKASVAKPASRVRTMSEIGCALEAHLPQTPGKPF